MDFERFLSPSRSTLQTNHAEFRASPPFTIGPKRRTWTFFSTLPFLNWTRAQREDKKLERQARLHFALYVNTYVSKDMLNGSAAEFKDKFDSFVSELKLHMLNTAN